MSMVRVRGAVLAAGELADFFLDWAMAFTLARA
jgi:hypothetical protein